MVCVTFDEYWKLNAKRLHSENPWREDLAREVWEAAMNNRFVELAMGRKHDQTDQKINFQTSQEKEETVPEGNV